MIYAAGTIAAFIAGALHPAALGIGMILLAVGAYCYFFWSPVAYELANGTLVVFFRASRKAFPSVVRCSVVSEPLSWATLRLCGNGGVFAGSGIFWNSRYGVFRAYVTRQKPEDLVLVETAKRRILISPEDPPSFVKFPD